MNWYRKAQEDLTRGAFEEVMASEAVARPVKEAIRVSEAVARRLELAHGGMERGGTLLRETLAFLGRVKHRARGEEIPRWELIDVINSVVDRINSASASGVNSPQDQVYNSISAVNEIRTMLDGTLKNLRG